MESESEEDDSYCYDNESYAGDFDEIISEANDEAEDEYLDDSSCSDYDDAGGEVGWLRQQWVNEHSYSLMVPSTPTAERQARHNRIFGGTARFLGDEFNRVADSVPEGSAEETKEEEKEVEPPKAKEARMTKSIIDSKITSKEVIWMSFDIETGGPQRGILQLSAVFYDCDGTQLGEFDEYCRPPLGAKFLSQACQCHGMMSRDDPNLVNAKTVKEVWKLFCDYVKRIFSGDSAKAGVLVAWNGKSCDMEYIFRLVMDGGNVEPFPDSIKYFMDPCYVIGYHKGCQLNPNKSKLPDLKLGTVYKHVTGEVLNEAHNSLYDCKAQGAVLFSDQFKDYQNRPKPIEAIDSVWAPKRKRYEIELQETTDPPHDPWEEQEAETWEPPKRRTFESSSGGGTFGTKQCIRNILDPINDAFEIMVAVFLFIIPWTLLETISEESQRYAFTDYVVETPVKDRGGSDKKKTILVPCDKTTPEKRHRVKKKAKEQWNFSSSPQHSLVDR